MCEKTPLLFRCLREAVRLFYPRTTLCGNVPAFDSPCLIIGNHSQMHGPIMCELYLPESTLTWCAAEVMDRREVPAYAMRCFWSEKPAHTRPFYHMLSRLIAPLCETVFTSARTLPVYLDSRVLTTFRRTVAELEAGRQIVIFPETETEADGILNQLHEHFVDLARLYHKRTGKSLAFLPAYLCPERHEMHFGEPIRYDPDRSPDEERTRICRAITEAIEQIARALPRHTVVPFVNGKKSERKTNRP